ncbi:uncharacterized protein N7473_004471 [Penicillium subrubescens]|uniref:uncharacterized protein n=1 Tax=Penicillium subrubescens TaxID=1316194 RepID=UPI0025459322|nr:uncharacterized protein N7473_004471 [Penicillium subrubescens]KAJ5900401.1 hypothetical protein N7473_004471 [Penicillium subrubescens]
MWQLWNPTSSHGLQLPADLNDQAAKGAAWQWLGHETVYQGEQLWMGWVYVRFWDGQQWEWRLWIVENGTWEERPVTAQAWQEQVDDVSSTRTGDQPIN